MHPIQFIPFLLPLTSALPPSNVPRQASPCTRASLLAAANLYIQAQTQGSLAPLTPLLSSNFSYVENNVALNTPFTRSTLLRPLNISSTRTIADTTLCATYTELIAPFNPSPYIIGTQLRLSPSDGKIALLDSVSSTTGSWLFDAAETLKYAQQESWTEIPEGKRDAREVLKAAGDAYLDLWSDATAEKRVPWGAPCARLEGGKYTQSQGGKGDSCKLGVPSNHNQKPNTNRRYVIDEAMGSVHIICLWEHMMNAADSHEFRLEGGKLRYIHTMTECGGRTCKL